MNSPVVLGKITGAFGVHGWVKVFSHTRPKENIFRYSPWLLDDGRRLLLLDGRRQGKLLIARLEGIDNRDQAAALAGSGIAVKRDQFPPPEPGEYYWADLIGLAVTNRAGQGLGQVAGLVETGANDVLIIQGEREYLVPFVQDVYVLAIDFDQGAMIVDWDIDF